MSKKHIGARVPPDFARIIDISVHFKITDSILVLFKIEAYKNKQNNNKKGSRKKKKKRSKQ